MQPHPFHQMSPIFPVLRVPANFIVFLLLWHQDGSNCTHLVMYNLRWPRLPLEHLRIRGQDNFFSLIKFSTVRYRDRGWATKQLPQEQKEFYFNFKILYGQIRLMMAFGFLNAEKPEKPKTIH